MSKLYELAQQYRQFNEMVENALDSGEELTEDDLQIFVDTIDSIQDSIESKVENIIKFLKNIDGDIKAFKEEEKRLAQRRKYLENKHEGLKNYTKMMLEDSGKTNFKAGLFNVRLQKNNPSVLIYDEKKIPEEFKTPQDPKINKEAILKLLTEEKLVNGAELAPEKKHLRYS